MRSPKWLSIITFFLCIIALLGIVLFNNNTGAKFIYDISLAIFGSALLGFIMSLIQYFDAKRNAMETFYQEALKAISDVGRVKYFFTDEPSGLLVKCIAEEVVNKWKEHDDRPLEYKCKTELIALHKATLPEEIIKSSKCVEHLEDWYTDKIQFYYEELEKCFKSYIDMSNAKLGDLDNAYGNMNFLFANSWIRKKAFESVYNPIRELKNSAARQAYHFQLYLSGEGNLAVCTSFLLELNEEWFDVKEVDNEQIHSIVVYRKEYDALSASIEKFRCKIYRQKYMPTEATPITSKIYHIEHKQ